MSHQAIVWALSQPVKPTSAKHLLTVLAHYVSATRPGPWVAFPSVSQLAQDTGQDRKTIMMNMRRLIEQGCIVDTGEREGGTKSVPVYMLAGHSSSTKIGTSLGGQSSTNLHTASTPEAVPIQGHLSSTRIGTASDEGSSTNFSGKQYQSTPEAVPIHPTEQVEQVLGTKDKGAAAASPPHAYVGAPARARDAEPLPPPTPDEAPTRAVQIAVMLRRNGADPRTYPSSRGIAELADGGHTDVQILTALETAKQRRREQRNPQPVTAAYLLPIVRDLRTATGPTGTAPRQTAAQRRSDWSRDLNDNLARLTGDEGPSPQIHDLGVFDASGNPVR